MYDPNKAIKKQLELMDKYQKERDNTFDKNWFNREWKHRNWTKKDEAWHTKRYYEIVNDYDELFKSGKRKKEDTQSVSTKRIRQDHCWKCKESVDNIYMLECPRCKRIVCSKCWSCGCWYKWNTILY